MATLTVTKHDDSGLPPEARRVPEGMRRCAGSTTFGIEAHLAPIADFPVQPSRKDGLGTMCKPHWTEYTRGLRQAQRARQGDPTPETPAAKAARPARAPRTAAKPKGGAGAAPKAQRAPRAKGPAKAAILEARQVLDETDRLSGPAYLEAVASDRVQDALRLLSTQADGPAIHDAMRTRMDEETER